MHRIENKEIVKPISNPTLALKPNAIFQGIEK